MFNKSFCDAYMCVLILWCLYVRPHFVILICASSFCDAYMCVLILWYLHVRPHFVILTCASSFCDAYMCVLFLWCLYVRIKAIRLTETFHTKWCSHHDMPVVRPDGALVFHKTLGTKLPFSGTCQVSMMASFSHF